MLLNYDPPKDPYLDILHIDNDLIVLNKPSGLLTVPGKDPAHRDSLEKRVQTVYPTATIVHRLDMATSGILIMALNKATHRDLSRQFQERLTQKRYIARIFGRLPTSSGQVDLPLICDWPNRPKQKVDHEVGKPSQTFWQVLETESEVTRVALTPITGRSHQLRVHMLSLDTPILGDRLYAHEKAKSMATRLQLHAEMLQVTHPITEKEMRFFSPCPF
ncbi:bifunctional tRNA pseudouridine(32) synthase/23S rRNA pseudouridine(746) synthase RluA [Algicola sagamiensis]|uniref:bifunctional tRNA pseudouridine(32) synthase/23S rRNA pseudouridine(746) synthase RluA n=1 Tax=Algicola sagamiensis TaxID=163869 RepID=UPI0003673D4A|nr:bifunctional tRNA pseudouridine(32) synthase/23S rRNA pseudouridine(746) synthase RluA [Algicola sagamiensis]